MIKILNAENIYMHIISIKFGNWTYSNIHIYSNYRELSLSEYNKWLESCTTEWKYIIISHVILLNK